EIRRIGSLGDLTLNVGAYSDYAADSLVQKATLAAGPATTLTSDANAGANVISVASRTGMAKGDVIQIGLNGDLIVIADLPNPQPAPNAGKVILATPIRGTHLTGAGVTLQNVTALTEATVIAADALGGSTQIVVSGMNGFANGDVIRVTIAQGAHFFH